MEPIDWIKKIELEYRVEDIKYDGIQLWPALRSYVRFAILRRKFGQVDLQQAKLNKGTILVLLKNVFVGIRHLFFKKEYFIFTSSKCRILSHGQYHDRVLGGISSILSGNSLYFENPYPNGLYRDVKKENRVSESILHLLSQVYQLLFYDKKKLSGLDVWNSLIKDLDIEVDISIYTKRFLGQYGVMNSLVKYHKPKAIFLISSNTLSGYIYAFKKNHIPVVEMQHGIISKKHASYNVFKNIGTEMRPDYLCVYSNFTKEVFHSNNYFIKPENVVATGYYFLDFIRKEKIIDKKFDDISNRFATKICVSMSDSAIEDSLNYIIAAAKLDNSKFFALVPRSIKTYENFELPDNVKVIDWLNVYECISLCDFHSTILSTCAIEAPALGVQNIIISIDSRSRKIFRGMLDDENITQFADTPIEFINVVDHMPRLTRDEIIVSTSHLILPEFKKNMMSFLEMIKN